MKGVRDRAFLIHSRIADRRRRAILVGLCIGVMAPLIGTFLVHRQLALIGDALARLATNRFACFVVGEIRDEHGFMRNFVGDTISAFLEAGVPWDFAAKNGQTPLAMCKQRGHPMAVKALEEWREKSQKEL